ncbi:MAG: exosortase/archaeosortase family protein, partial [Burkholderiaceae bacterium]|nr:exosortase/archaeosortase family protein [Burkholderiaceae bacterium]
ETALGLSTRKFRSAFGQLFRALNYNRCRAVIAAHVHKLALAGFDVVARGAAFEHAGRTILVDPPCAGIGMLWVGAYTAALLSHLTGASARRALVNGLFATAAVFAANVLRNALLFFPESGLLRAPGWAHDAIGLAAFAAAIVPVVAFVHARRA